MALWKQLFTGGGSRPPPVVALEIGTTKVVALVGELREDGHIVITGIGDHQSTGVRKGEVIDLDHALVCVQGALNGAETSGQVGVHSVHLVMSGGHIETMVHRGTIPVLDPAQGVSAEDVQQVTDVARAVNLSADRRILHSIGQTFLVDGERVGRPEGFDAAELSLDMIILHAKTSHLRNAVKVVRNLSVDVADVAFSGLCSALAVLTPEQKEDGVLVVDMGGGVTDYVAYAANMFAAAGAIGVGGDHVTNDILLAFNIPRVQAERLKLEHGSALHAEGERGERIALPAEGSYHPGATVNPEALHTVIHLRMAELFRLIRSRLDREGLLHLLGAGVVLTGGGSQMRGVCELAQEVFRLPCTVGRPTGVSGLAAALEGPQYAAAVGMIKYAFKNAAAAPARGSRIGDRLRYLLGGEGGDSTETQA
jgi:cell division protein FtsA